MNFEFSEDQLSFRDYVRQFLADQCPLSLVRDIFETDKMYADNLWQQITKLGWTAVTIPEEYGGLGLGQLELCSSLEANVELERHLSESLDDLSSAGTHPPRSRNPYALRPGD